MKSPVWIVCLIASAACAAQDVEPAPGAGAPSTAMVSSELGNACTLQCNNATLQCNATCDRFPRPGCEENCDTRFTNCMRACGCPFNEDLDRVTFDHADATGTQLCVGNVPNAGLVYNVFNIFNRTDHVRQTLQCDGTINETLLSSVVSAAGTCSSRVQPNQTCLHSTSFPQQVCMF